MAELSLDPGIMNPNPMFFQVNVADTQFFETC